MPLLSDFVAVCTEGDTVDGRVIEATWLEEAAETYSTKKFTAVINLNHWNKTYYGTFGAVDSLKLGKSDDGKVQLLARIEPNDRLVQMSRTEVLFTSIELEPDFLKSGKWYMDGLAITPDPASSGTERLRFACQSAAQGEKVYTDFVRTELTFSEVPKDDDAPSWFSKYLASRKKDNQEENTDMSLEKKVDDLTGNVEKLTQMFANLHPEQKEVVVDDATIAALKAQGYSVDKKPTEQELAAQVEALTALGYTIQTPATGSEDADDNPGVVTQEQFTALQKTINELAGKEVFTNIGDENPGSDADSVTHL